MTIVMIAPMNNTMYGLGSDDKLYVWNASTKGWNEA